MQNYYAILHLDFVSNYRGYFMATFTNNATLSYNGNTTVSNTVVGTIQEVLTLAKSAVVGNYSTDCPITYVISLVNSGSTALTNLTVTDNLGAYTLNTNTLYPLTYIADSVNYYVNGVLTAAPAVTAGPPLTFTGVNVPANGNALIIYEVNTNQYAPLATGNTISNTATVSGATLPTPITSTELVTVQSEPTLTISKSLSPTVVTDNDQITYTFTIQNTGNTAATAAANIVLTDDLNPILNPITVTFNGTNWVSPTNYTYDTTTGIFSTVAGQITVPAATYTQDPTTGVWTVTPGISTLVITGTI